LSTEFTKCLKKIKSRRAVSVLRKKICLFYRELRLSLAEIARKVGVGTTGGAIVIRKEGN
jgi:hypothetical protein